MNVSASIFGSYSETGASILDGQLATYVRGRNDAESQRANFVLKMPTAGLVDGKVKDEWSAKMWKVTGTKKVGGRRTSCLNRTSSKNPRG